MEKDKDGIAKAILADSNAHGSLPTIYWTADCVHIVASGGQITLTYKEWTEVAKWAVQDQRTSRNVAGEVARQIWHWQTQESKLALRNALHAIEQHEGAEARLRNKR